MHFYTDPTRESDTYALPDARVYELTAREVAEMDDDTIDSYMRRREFRLPARFATFRALRITRCRDCGRPRHGDR